MFFYILSMAAEILKIIDTRVAVIFPLQTEGSTLQGVMEQKSPNPNFPDREHWQLLGGPVEIGESDGESEQALLAHGVIAELQRIGISATTEMLEVIGKVALGDEETLLFLLRLNEDQSPPVDVNPDRNVATKFRVIDTVSAETDPDTTEFEKTLIFLALVIDPQPPSEQLRLFNYNLLSQVS